MKSYYSVIPAEVRYDKHLSPNAKLLYGEITALCNEKGYCWASNKYFADLYGVTKDTASKWISSLVKEGYISVAVHHKEGSREITGRTIYLLTKLSIPIDEKIDTPIDEIVEDNNTDINNTYEYRKEIYKEKHKYGTYNNVLLNDEELEKLKTEFPTDFTERIERVSEYCASKGVSYKNYLATIRNWARRDKTEKKEMDYDDSNNPTF